MNRSQRGFTLIELVIVIIILGILSAIALPRFLNLGDDADIAAVKSTGGAFKSAITLAHTKWAIMGSEKGKDANNDVQLYGSGTEGQMDFNDEGWPVQSFDGPDEDELSLDSKSDCITVWNTILHTGNKIDTDLGYNDEFTAEYAPNYVSGGAAGVCFYQRTGNPALYIRYNSNTGAVATFVP